MAAELGEWRSETRHIHSDTFIGAPLKLPRRCNERASFRNENGAAVEGNFA